jgi:hypothetical protein
MLTWLCSVGIVLSHVSSFCSVSTGLPCTRDFSVAADVHSLEVLFIFVSSIKQHQKMRKVKGF